MEAILEFLRLILEFVWSWIDYCLGFMSDLAFIVMLTGRYLLHLPQYFFWLPSELLTILLTTLTIVVIYKVIGREG